MKKLHYKGIVFDDYEKTEDGEYWAEICHSCVGKYHNLIKDEIDDGGTARGCCSVFGCENSGDNENVLHFYIDFDGKFVNVEK